MNVLHLILTEDFSKTDIKQKEKQSEKLFDSPFLEEMAGNLSSVASRIMGGNGIVGRSIFSSLRLRSGMGLPVGKHIVPDKPVPVNDELVWDNGTPFPEPCIDRLAPTIGKYEALGWLCGGLGFFATLGLLAVWNDKASKIPFVSVIPENFKGMYRWLNSIRLFREDYETMADNISEGGLNKVSAEGFNNSRKCLRLAGSKSSTSSVSIRIAANA
ncbi:hypothetical protein ACLOJK_028985 [Asimina triloba]